MNNIFTYATKELSQDAFLCWSINWLTQDPNNALYQYGKAMLDLFLGDKKQDHYQNVEIRSQYEKIDVLVLFKGTDNKRHALIIEDKTNTTEHSNQMQRYKEKVTQQNPAHEIHLAYIKTGIMYDEDFRMVDKGAVVVQLDDLLLVVAEYAKLNVSEILTSFHAYIAEIKDERKRIEDQIQTGHYESALQDYYGQFYFLDRIFSKRSRGLSIGDFYKEHDANFPVLIDNIYAGTNQGGTPWCQYCFWGEKYPSNHVDENKNEYHYLFWRIDLQAGGYYLALRHYDALAHSKTDKYLNERKKYVYNKFRERANNESERKKNLFKQIGERGNYKESDLLFIPVKNLEGMPFSEVSNIVTNLTRKFSGGWDDLYANMDKSLEGK